VVALSEFCVSVLATAGAEALSNFGFQYLSQVYLPQKLRDGDWI
jgi:meiotic recombination protein SPO11